MALKKTILKLNDYFERLEENKADRIKAAHVEKVISKLKAKEESLKEDLKSAQNPRKKERTRHKLKVVKEQISRADYLLEQIATDKDKDK